MEAGILIGGEAGQGVQSVGFILSKIFSRGGYFVYSDQDYESRVRGGHNFFRVRVKESKISAVNSSIDLLIALNKESISLHQEEVNEDGIVLFDPARSPDVKGEGLFPVPFTELAGGNELISNTAALGACLGLIGFEPLIAEDLLTEAYGGEKAEINVKALHAGYKYAQDNFKKRFHIKLSRRKADHNLLINGNEALALGAIAGGCKFISSYPMTPATPILEYMISKSSDMDLVAVQPEDEISAVNMAVGAGFSGVRALTATSGSGFCLMVEGLGLAGITETPVVIVDAQRPGPAVGLPTRTEQGDLQFVIYAHHGEFPRAVLAPSTVEEAFYLTVKAFNLAEKFQIPVIILTDHLLASSYQTVPGFDFRKVKIDRGNLYEADKDGKPENYKRHLITESGISPRALPGLSEALVMTDSDEHGEEGHMIEDGIMRSKQVEKRLRKYKELRKEISAPLMYGAENAEITLVSWGSSFGAVHEAVDILNGEEIKAGMIHFSELWPFPAEQTGDLLGKSKKCIAVEGNATGQLARLIRTETGIKIDGRILKYDGRPFTPSYIAERVRKEEVSSW